MRRITLMLSVFFTLIFNVSTFSQVGIGTTTPDNSAILDLSTNNKGVLVPRLSTTQMNNISDPANGLLIFNQTNDAFYYNAGTAVSPDWIPFFAPGKNDTLITNVSWGLNGNSGIDETINFIGTKDTMDLVFKVNNKTWGSINGNNNFLGVGLDNPFAPITIFDSRKTTDSNTTASGLYVVRSIPEGSVGRDVAIVGQATGKGTSSSISEVHAFFGIASYDGLDTLRSLTGYTSVVNNDSNGVVEEARGINVVWVESNLTVNPLAEILTGYGIFIHDVEAINGYGIYQIGSDDANYFAGNTGIGVNATTPKSTLEVKGSVSFNIKEVTASYIVTETDYTISIAPTANDTITIPTATPDNKGRIYIVKRDADGAGNTITLNTNDLQSIEGVVNVPLNGPYEKIILQSTGTKWIRIIDFKQLFYLCTILNSVPYQVMF